MDGAIEKSKGNPAWVKGQSGNPAGRPKGTVSVAADVKESIIKTFYSAGGPDRLIRIMNAKDKKADDVFLSFVKNIIIPLLPKKTEYDIEHRSVTFIFGDGSQKTLKSSEALEDVIDLDVSEEEESKSQE
jgi:hypothetical protein